MSSEEAFDAALDLLRRLDPTHIQKHLLNLIELEPSLAEDLLSSTDTPLSVQRDPKSSQREYLCCDYNRDIDSYRSPWSNDYYPPLADADLVESPFPSGSLRKLEIIANDSFDIYRDLYYEGGISSVYLWDLEEESRDFAGVVLFKKSDQSSSNWDSIHVLEVIFENDVEATYRVTTTIILHLDKQQKITLSGNLTRQTEKTLSVPSDATEEQLNVAHITNLGTLIEDIESQMRNLLETVYFEKTRDIYHEVRSSITGSDKLNKANQEEVIKGLQNL
ncbi:hypothetical protein Kpol_1063p5 [Vanderwaltozyma polyspora DSM 70294]|uniref:F-actin-capping protein subunit beta n=1 Tax=Vanderwaltozyma polyspora (strain ATCC 22028 / DSM 70294 / BCRC 21397 / CBS 2163 / NBRC 10782 / NRRL Y-8283 / UCD 57-17) TaxID=436907 RepID=A7TQQ0_VANPO|nr:uncharacterized protein Kpol_1063p5 [Vanderwaltozyma polyspora DSM 70294]EDO15395.1 hypothetical protein Kpol_1063p5 [Vanderwaltozyma polyspora DSM 70294]